MEELSDLAFNYLAESGMARELLRSLNPKGSNVLSVWVDPKQGQLVGTLDSTTLEKRTIIYSGIKSHEAYETLTQMVRLNILCDNRNEQNRKRLIYALPGELNKEGYSPLDDDRETFCGLVKE